VHGNILPENVLFNTDGTAILAGMGLWRVLEAVPTFSERMDYPRLAFLAPEYILASIGAPTTHVDSLALDAYTSLTNAANVYSFAMTCLQVPYSLDSSIAIFLPVSIDIHR